MSTQRGHDLSILPTRHWPCPGGPCPKISTSLFTEPRLVEARVLIHGVRCIIAPLDAAAVNHAARPVAAPVVIELVADIALIRRDPNDLEATLCESFVLSFPSFGFGFTSSLAFRFLGGLVCVFFGFLLRPGSRRCSFTRGEVVVPGAFLSCSMSHTL